tara:strand:+ start:195 stop:500 length:306 start_codon:yes stop_codon:yes gene_type:complete
MDKLSKTELTYLFKLINEDLNNHGIEIRIGQAIMNNLRAINYQAYSYLSETNVDPFYNENNVLESIDSISELDKVEIFNLLNESISDEFKNKLKTIEECVK